MTSASLTVRREAATAPTPAKLSLPRRLLALLACIYVACLTVQVFLAGLGVFVNPIWFQRHKTFVHSFGWLDFVLLILVFAARAPTTLKRLVATLVVLVGIQYSTILLRGPLHSLLIGALHPVSAVLLYATALAIARGAWRLTWPPRST